MKVSVITVCLNSKKTLERTILSVLNQKIKNLEYIIIDGNSSDGTQEIIKKYENRISYWTSESDNGLFFAMNKGIEKATGDIIAILNSDDYYEPDTLVRVCDYFKDDVDIVCGDEYVITNGIKKLLKINYNEQKEIHKRIIYCHPAFFVRKSAYKKVGLFNTKYVYSSDYEWMIRAYDNNLKILKVNDVFTNCEDGGFGSSHPYEAVTEQRDAALEHALNEEMKDEIKEFYISELEHAKYIQNYNRIMNSQEIDIDEKIKNMGFNEDRPLYLWGTGRNGERALFLCKKLRIVIKGFIDSNILIKEKKGVPVYSPKELKDGINIIITPFEYSAEIKRTIGELGFSDIKYWDLYAFVNDIVD